MKEPKESRDVRKKKTSDGIISIVIIIVIIKVLSSAGEESKPEKSREKECTQRKVRMKVTKRDVTSVVVERIYFSLPSSLVCCIILLSKTAGHDFGHSKSIMMRQNEIRNLERELGDRN